VPYGSEIGRLGRGVFNNANRMKRILLLSTSILVASTWSGAAADAKATYDKSCAKCHGADGKGATAMGKKLSVKDYTDATVQAQLTDDAAVKAIKEGLKDKAGKTLMKPAEGLSDADIKGLVAYMRAFKK
jgi:cytochrome c553